MKHLIDGCGKEREWLLCIKGTDCEECLEILHKRAAQKLLLAYESLCDVKWQRYEAAFKAASKEIEDKRVIMENKITQNNTNEQNNNHYTKNDE